MLNAILRCLHLTRSKITFTFSSLQPSVFFLSTPRSENEIDLPLPVSLTVAHGFWQEMSRFSQTRVPVGPTAKSNRDPGLRDTQDRVAVRYSRSHRSSRARRDTCNVSVAASTVTPGCGHVSRLVPNVLLARNAAGLQPGGIQRRFDMDALRALTRREDVNQLSPLRFTRLRLHSRL